MTACKNTRLEYTRAAWVLGFQRPPTSPNKGQNHVENIIKTSPVTMCIICLSCHCLPLLRQGLAWTDESRAFRRWWL